MRQAFRNPGRDCHVISIILTIQKERVDTFLYLLSNTLILFTVDTVLNRFQVVGQSNPHKYRLPLR